MAKIEDIFQLNECLDWIIDNCFERIVIQLKKEDLKHSAAIITYLTDKSQERFTTDSKCPKNLDLYVTQSSTCCIDLLVTQHISNINAIIHIGKVCLSKPHLANHHGKTPVLFVFKSQIASDTEFPNKLRSIVDEIKSIVKLRANSRICLLYDTALVDYANNLETILLTENLTESIDVANLYFPSENWYTIPQCSERFSITRNQDAIKFGYYQLKRAITDYSCAIYLGDCLSIQLALSGPSELYKINCYVNVNLEKVNTSKLLSRRIALVDRLKEEEELNIGVIITNPLPEISTIVDELENYSKPRKHTLYFISMIQTIDECKIGNFDLCDAFIVINSCTCSTILESLVFNRPIITKLEYKLACGFEAEYGRVIWPGSSSHLSLDDLANKRKVSDVSSALIHTRNELLERCSQTRANKWSGLDYKASVGSGCGESSESLAVEEGLKGIASSYVSEPLTKKKDANSETVGKILKKL